MVIIQHGTNRATWNGKEWTSDNEALSLILNAKRFLSRGYWPDEVNARVMWIASFGDSGWSIVRSDPQPVETGVIY